MEEQSALLAADRRGRIAEIVSRQGFVRVSELSEMYQVSEVTIRNDLDLLARQGLVVRDRGGAVVNKLASLTIAFEQRAAQNLDEKRRIGRAATQLVRPGDTIIMDAGSTMMEMAKSLGDVTPLTVVTNALNVATQVGSLPECHVILVGGSLNRETISTIGPHVERELSDLVVQKAFLGIHAMDPELGLSDASIEIAQAKRALIRTARQVILLADASKWGRVGFAKVGPLSTIHTLVTDSSLPAGARAAIEHMGIKLILV